MKTFLLIFVLIFSQGCLVHVIQGVASLGVGLYQNNKINKLEEKINEDEKREEAESSLEGQAADVSGFDSRALQKEN